MKTINIEKLGIKVNLDDSDSLAGKPVCGSINTDWRETIAPDPKDWPILDTIESLILGHACMGIDIESDMYVNGIQSMLDAFSNNS